MLSRHILLVRAALLATSAGFVAATVADQYEKVEALVRFICINCLGLSG